MVRKDLQSLLHIALNLKIVKLSNSLCSLDRRFPPNFLNEDCEIQILEETLANIYGVSNRSDMFYSDYV